MQKTAKNLPISKKINLLLYKEANPFGLTYAFISPPCIYTTDDVTVYHLVRKLFPHISGKTTFNNSDKSIVNISIVQALLQAELIQPYFDNPLAINQ